MAGRARLTRPRLEAEEIERVRALLPAAGLRRRSQDIDATAGRDAGVPGLVSLQHATARVPGYRAVFVSLKAHGRTPGDMTSEQMEAVAALADRVSFGLIRVTHNQNLLLATCARASCTWSGRSSSATGLAMPNIGTLTDMIACPGLDFCCLANAGTLNVAKQIQQRFDDLDYLYDLGDIEIKMSGCMNACGHHHVGHIGILGVDKHGEEWYQITLGGSVNGFTALGEVIGPSVPQSEVAATIERIVEVYRACARTMASASSIRCAGSASSPSRSAHMRRILRRHEIVADEWRHLGEEPSEGAALIVPLAQLRADAPRWLARPGRLGVRLAPVERVEELTQELPRLELVAVEFPTAGEAAATRKGGCCASGWASAASCAPWARACARTRCSCWPAADSMPFELAAGEDLEAARRALSRYDVAYQPGAPEIAIRQQRLFAWGASLPSAR